MLLLTQICTPQLTSIELTWDPKLFRNKTFSSAEVDLYSLKSLLVASEATILRIRLCCYDLLLLLFCLVLSQSQEARVHLVHCLQLSAMGWLSSTCTRVISFPHTAALSSLSLSEHCTQHADAGTVEASVWLQVAAERARSSTDRSQPKHTGGSVRQNL